MKIVEESLIGWITSSVKAARQSFPQMAKVIGIQLAIEAVFQMMMLSYNLFLLLSLITLTYLNTDSK